MSNTALNRTEVVLLTNKSGGDLAQGAVVIVDSANAAAFTTTTTSGSANSIIGVVLDPGGITSNATGTVAVGGYVPKVNLSGSASLGDFFKTHTVAGQAVRHAPPAVEGDFGEVLGTGTTPAAILFGYPVQAGSGTVTSVGLSLPDTFTVTNSPVTGSGNLTGAWVATPANGSLLIGNGSSYVSNRLTAGSNVTITNSSGSITIAATGGGGGATIFETAYASPPTPASGDLWLITDSMLSARYNGSAWSYYWGSLHVTKPDASVLSTWHNQGSATLTDKGELTLYTPAAAADNVRGLTMTAPSLNYTIDAILIPGTQQTTTFGAYIGWSDGTAIITYGIGNTNGSYCLELIKWTNATTFSAIYATANRSPFAVWGGNPVWLRITEDASNRTCYYSLDWGRTYIQFHQVGRTDFLTATQTGFFVFNNQASIPTSLTLLSWHAY